MTIDKIALVTGANRGLGRSAAIALATRGVRVVVTHRGDTAGAEKTAEQVQAVGGTVAVLRLDISDVPSFASFTSGLGAQLERWGTPRLDTLVNNAGVGVFGPLETVTIDDFDTVMGTNVRARSSSSSRSCRCWPRAARSSTSRRH